MANNRGSVTTENPRKPGVNDILLAFGVLVILLPAFAVWINLKVM
jgi:hypothetical protein